MSSTKVKSVKELKRIAKRYFTKCDTEQRPYTMSGLAEALGIARRTLKEYERRDDFGATVAAFKRKIEAQMEERMLLGTSAAGPSQFSLKNNFNWTDKIEIETHGDINIKTVKEIPTSTLVRLLPAEYMNQIEKQSKAAYQLEELEEDNKSASGE
jgi:hypothetical protein